MGTKLEISDDILWGKLVKSWATGKNYITSDQPPPALPRTMEDLQAQAADIGLTIIFPDGMVGLEIVQYSSETAVIKLPPKSMIEETEADLAEAEAEYPMPRFYDDFYGGRLPPMSTNHLLDLHAGRIGDYSVRNCG